MGNTPDHHRDGHALPPDVEAAIHTMNVDVGAAETVLAFRDAGIRSILLKGPALASWLYDHQAAREYVDIDLLVSPEQLSAGEEILTRLGFHPFGLDLIPGDWPKHARTWTREDGRTIDLHLTLVGVGVDAGELWRAFSERTERMEVAGTEMEVLAPPARALLVALNAAKSGATVAKVRRDLEHALSRVPLATWREAAELADSLKATEAFGAGLRRVPAGRELAGQMGLTNARTTQVLLRERKAPPLSIGIDWLLSTPGGQGKLRLILRKLFPPKEYLRAFSPLARRGPVGLAAAYAWRPLWVFMKAGPALWAWFKARRGAARGVPPS